MTTTASVYFNKIRVDYPQAGKDNDSQGFRDNFRNIFNAFSATNVLLEDLDKSSVKLNGNNNEFGYNEIKNVSLQSSVTALVDYSSNDLSGNIYVDFRESNYQKYKLAAGTTTFLINNWPQTDSNGNPISCKSEIELSVTPATTASTTIVFGGGSYIPVGGLTLPVVSTSISTRFFSLWTDDNGSTVYILQKGV